MAHRGLAIAGQNFDPDTTLPKCGNSSRCIRTQPLPHGKYMESFPMPKGDDRRFGIAVKDIVSELIRAAEGRSAQSDLNPVDKSVHALTGNFLDPGQRCLSLGRARHCCGDWVMASASRPASSNTLAGILAALATSSSGKVSVPVLSNTTPVDFGQPLDASPELSRTPGPEQGARHHSLHGGNRQTERTRAGDDQNRDRQGGPGAVRGQSSCLDAGSAGWII
ncbi:MAG: hypothetical protein JWR80_7431 [Bradyrhizobium sp.]|nr:hypothetical protein [Bradyrhizobium sp.]